MKKEIENKLIDNARKGMNNAHSAVHNFPVGAAVLASSGNIYFGCNIETVISGLGICAERCAIDNAISHGEKKIKAIAIISKNGEPIAPCGICLQYISNFAEGDVDILMVGAEGKIKRSSLRKMLPFDPFQSNYLDTN